MTQIIVYLIGFLCFALPALAIPGPSMAADLDALYTSTPSGFVLKHCVHQVPSGSHLEQKEDGTMLVTHEGVIHSVLPLCDNQNGALPVLIHELPSVTAARLADSTVSGLPADYDGWEGYTAYYKEEGFDSFLGNFSVPAAPAYAPQMLYLFTGLQNINWIPKVDPEPTNPFDIIQPVLQYPGDYGEYWSVKSWFVTLDIGAIATNEVEMKTGDVVFGNMTQTATQTWFVNSVNTRTGQSTYFTTTHKRLQKQPWAYTTLECYGCQSCSTYPANSPCQFTGMSLTSAGQPVTAEWKVNPQPSGDMKCHEKPVVRSAKAITYYFDYQG